MANQEELNLKLKAMDIDDHHNSDEMPIIDDDDEDNHDDLDSDIDDCEYEDEYEDEDEDECIWAPKEPERQVYQVEAKQLKDGKLVKFPLHYSFPTSTTLVADIKKQVAQLLGLEQDSFMMSYVDADQDLVYLKTRDNLWDPLSVVDSSSSSVLRLDIIAK